MEKILVLDANARGKGIRYATLDVIGIGPRIIVSILKSFGFYVQLEPYEKITHNKSILNEFDVLAISFMVSDFPAVRKIINIWRSMNNGLVVLGGPGTLDTNRLSTLNFDIAFKGEAEITLLKILKEYKSLNEFYLAQIKNPNTINGLALKIGDKLIDGGISPWTPKEVINNIMPDIESIRNYPFYWASRIYVETVRGCSNFYRPQAISEFCRVCNICRSGDLGARIKCPSNIPPGCGYCNVPMIHGFPRSRDPYKIVSEVEALLKLGATRIVLSAPDFLDYGRELLVNGPLTDPCYPPPNIDMIEHLLQMITKIPKIMKGEATVSIENVKACLIDEYVAEILGKYLRDTAIYIGLESCSDKLLELIGRPSKCRDTLRAIELLSKYGLRPYVYLMYGIPLETREDIDITIKMLDDPIFSYVERIVLYKFRPLPYTPLEKILNVNTYTNNGIIKQLYEKVKEFNTQKKRHMLYRKIDVIIASTYNRDPRYLVAYPLKHGPVTLIKTAKRFIGYIATVRITKIISDRMVLGEIIRLGKRVVNHRIYER